MGDGKFGISSVIVQVIGCVVGGWGHSRLLKAKLYL